MTTTATECRHYWQSGYDTNTCLYCGRTHPAILEAALVTYSKEARRLRAYELIQQGWKQKDIATALGVTKGAVSQWVSQARQGGTAALHSTAQPTNPQRQPVINDPYQLHLEPTASRAASSTTPFRTGED